MSVTGIKIPDAHKSKDKRLILAHGLRGFRPQLAGSKSEKSQLTSWWPRAAQLVASRKQSGEEQQTKEARQSPKAALASIFSSHYALRLTAYSARNSPVG